uniref:GTPase IMAP family member 4-like n=1 Tax=Mastacembelus armatus TaxID=205130 RepID=A0A7N8WVY5_9TELE
MDNPNESEKPELRILLWGRTDHGRSTLGNAILGTNCFQTDQAASSVTNVCAIEKKEFDGQTLAIVDTPGLFRTETDEKEMMKDILHIVMSVYPGPHVILLVLKYDQFTYEDRKALEIFKKVYPDAAAYTIAVVTHADQSISEADAKTFLQSKEPLKEFAQNFCLFKINYQNAQLKGEQQQIKDLLKMIITVAKKPKYCRSELINKSKDVFEKAMKRPDVNTSTKLVDFISHFLSNEVPALKHFFDVLESVAYNCIKANS